MLGALELSALQPVGNGSWTEVWGPSILPPMIMGRRGACRGNVIASAWPELPPSPDLPLVPWLFWWDVFPCGHGPMLVCSPRTHAKSWGSSQAMSTESVSLLWLGEGDVSSDLVSPGKRGHSPQRVTAPRCHGRVGAVPGQPDPWHWSQLRPPHLAPLSLDTFNPPGRGMQPDSTGRVGGTGCTQ